MSNVNSAVKTAKVSKAPETKFGKVQVEEFVNRYKLGTVNLRIFQPKEVPVITNPDSVSKGLPGLYAYKKVLVSCFLNDGFTPEQSKSMTQIILSFPKGRIVTEESFAPIPNVAQARDGYDIDSLGDKQVVCYKEEGTDEEKVYVNRQGFVKYRRTYFDRTGEIKDTFVDAEAYVTPNIAERIANQA